MTMIDSTNTETDPVSQVDADGMIEFLADIVNTPSPTGSELAVAQVACARLDALGVPAELQEFAPGRANVIARLEGNGDGPTVMLNGHLDTSYSGEEPELVGRGYKNHAVIDGDWMYGNGVHNMKSALASFVYAMNAIHRSGRQLSGEIVLACVAGEIEKAPFGVYQGQAYEGFGVGTAFALSHGLTADMCILGEPTTNTIGLSNLGVAWLRVRTHGTMAHTQNAETATNAIYEAMKLIPGLRVWMEGYRDRHAYAGIRPSCDITAIEGGWSYRVSRTPVFCDTFICARIPPGMPVIQVKRELQLVLRELCAKHDVDGVDIEMYVAHAGAEISADERIVKALHTAHRQVVGSEPTYRPRGAYMDSSHLVAYGIPTVVYGPSGLTRTSGKQHGWSPEEGEHTYLPDLVQHCRVVTQTLTDVCLQ